MKKRFTIFISIILFSCGDAPRDKVEDHEEEFAGDATAPVAFQERLSDVSDPDAEHPLEPDAPHQNDAAPTDDETMAVDVGNPKETGPKPKGGLKLWLADAPIDSASSFVLEIAALHFVPIDLKEPVVVVNLPETIDLLDYQQGNSHLLFDDQIPVGEYSEIRLQLAQLPQIFFSPGSSPSLVDLSLPATALTLTGQASITISTDQEAEVLWHFPLWKSLLSDNDAYLLSATYPLISPAAVGSLELLGILPATTLAICVSKGSLLDLPTLLGGLMPGNHDCSEADGRVLAKSETAIVPFLKPGSYVIDIYVTESLFVRLPYLVDIAAGVTETLAL